MNRCVLCAQILRSMAAMVWGNGENLAAWEIDHLLYLDPFIFYLFETIKCVC